MYKPGDWVAEPRPEGGLGTVLCVVSHILEVHVLPSLQNMLYCDIKEFYIYENGRTIVSPYHGGFPLQGIIALDANTRYATEKEILACLAVM